MEKIILNGIKTYPVKHIKIQNNAYNLSIFSEDEDLNLFEGFLFEEIDNKSELSHLIRYRTPVSGYVPRLSLLIHNNQLLIKDYRRNKFIRKTLEKTNKPFISKLKKALSEPNETNFNKLFDRTDLIEEFYILYKKARDYLLKNIKGISGKEQSKEFVNNFMMQMLTLWYLQEREFFDKDTSYLITKFNDLKQKKLFNGFNNYYEFLTYFFEKICNHSDSQYYEDSLLGKVVVVGPSIFLNGEHDSKAISVPDNCFYKEGMTDILINTQPKKVSQDVPLLNLLESRDWIEGNIDEFVLGAIYEKLITHIERKKLGAYYTPEEITSYICKNTIEPYLTNRINENFNQKFERINQIIKTNNREILLHLFNQLKEIKILDPAVGSAHFLESAINILLNIYEKIWGRAKELGIRKGLNIVAADERGKLKTINLLEISDEEQFKMFVKFFIILSKNVYGVDINPLALKVAKARLFLTLAKHFDVHKKYFIRFPNVHFNLREGNSLIGYVELDREKEKAKGQLILDSFVKEEDKTYITEAIKIVSELKEYLKETAEVLGIQGEVAKELEKLNEILPKKEIKWNNFQNVLKTKEKLIRILIASLNSKYARPLNELINQITELFNQKLDEKFAKEHNIDLAELKQIKTFHWAFEFPEVFLDGGGFNVVVGNPPYVELNEVEYGYLLRESRNLYDEFIRVSIKMLRQNGMFGFIHANSAYCQPKFKALRIFLKKNMNDLIIINFAIRPQPMFKGIMQRTAIIICKKDPSEPKKVKTSRYLRLTAENRNEILANLPLYGSSNFAFKFDAFIPKIGNKLDYEIFIKLFLNNRTLDNLIDKNGIPIFYHDSGESYWTKALNYEPKGIRDGKEVKASQWFEIKIEPIYADFVLCAINSTLFYWFWLAISDCRDLTQKVIKQFPIPHEEVFTMDTFKKLENMSRKLMVCYKENSIYVEKRKGYKSLEFKINRCKSIIDEIDQLIGGIYTLTDQEIEYLIEYDLEMKMGG
jgi:hypothetical protein